VRPVLDGMVFDHTQRVNLATDRTGNAADGLISSGGGNSYQGSPLQKNWWVALEALKGRGFQPPSLS